MSDAHTNSFKEYLGDGAYVQFDGYGIDLTTEDGYSVTNRIYLEPEVWAALVRYVENLKALAALKKPQGDG